MTKGFVLTLDAVLAAIVALTISALIMGMLAVSDINYYEYQGLTSVGNDLLAILDLTGKFNEYTDKTVAEGNADLKSQLNVLPTHYCANATVRLYDSNGGFTLYKKFNATKSGCLELGDCLQKKGCGGGGCGGKEEEECIEEVKGDFTKVKRIYVDFDNEKFGLVEVELWLK